MKQFDVEKAIKQFDALTERPHRGDYPKYRVILQDLLTIFQSGLVEDDKPKDRIYTQEEVEWILESVMCGGLTPGEMIRETKNRYKSLKKGKADEKG